MGKSHKRLALHRATHMQNDNEAWVARARAVRIEDECARRNITLKGNTERCGPCPKCGGEDRFAINTTKQVFNCRGCEVGGEVLALVQHLDGIDFVKAVEKLTGEPPPKSKKKKGKSAGGAQTYSPTIARYVYRQAEGTPYLQVCRTQAKKFFQNRWNGQMWIPGKPAGPKLPYRLPELLAAAPTTPVHLCEGEKDVDALAKLGFVATTNSEGAGNWADNLNAYFRDRSVYIHEDNDKEGRKRCQRIARALEPIAKTVRIICLPDLPEHGDVSDWLQHDPSGAQLARLCESAPCWEPPADDASEEVEKEKPDEDDIEVSSVWKKQADVLIDLAA